MAAATTTLVQANADDDTWFVQPSPPSQQSNTTGALTPRSVVASSATTSQSGVPGYTWGPPRNTTPSNASAVERTSRVAASAVVSAAAADPSTQPHTDRKTSWYEDLLAALIYIVVSILQIISSR